MLDKIDLKTLKDGMIKVSGFKVVICGISRDNASDLPEVIKHIDVYWQIF